MFLRCRKIGNREYFSIEERVWDSVKKSPKGRTVVTLGPVEQARKKLDQAFAKRIINQGDYDRFLAKISLELTEATELAQKAGPLEDKLIGLRGENEELKQEVERLRTEKDYFRERFEAAKSETNNLLREFTSLTMIHTKEKSEQQHLSYIIEAIRQLAKDVDTEKTWYILVPPGRPPHIHRGELGEIKLGMQETEVIPIKQKDKLRIFFKLSLKALSGENIFGE